MGTQQNRAVVGTDAAAYTERDSGFSNDDIREAAIGLVGSDVRGVVLDAGSGHGTWLRKLLGACPEISKAIAVDIYDGGARAVPGVEFFQSDLSRSPLPRDDQSVDWVFAIEVLEHLANPRAFVGEAFRVLRKGGTLFVSTPNNDALTSRLSLLFRGYYPAFSEQCYTETGHITPILELDLRRMSGEAGFGRIEFFFPLTGRIPKSNVPWQRFFPALRGSLWSDTLFCRLTK